jgi:hypothetical protein
MQITADTDTEVRRIVTTMCRGASIEEMTNLVLRRLEPKRSLEKPIEHFVRKTTRLERKKNAEAACRRRRRERSLSASMPSSTKPPLMLLVEEEEREAIRDECRRLPEKEFDAINGYFQFDHGHLDSATFAAKWKCSPKEIYRYRDAALKRLRCAIRKRGLDD